jgi:hypothetical protein
MSEIAPTSPAPPPGAGPETGVAITLGALLPPGEDAQIDTTAIATHLEGLAADAARYAEKASGDGTRRAYGSAWAAYAGWCQRHGLDPLAGDPGIVALYLTARAKTGLAVSSLGVARAAIRARHRMAKVPLDLDDPRVTRKRCPDTLPCSREIRRPVRPPRPTASIRRCVSAASRSPGASAGR